MIWIIGEYGERIDNSIDLMMNFSENFKEESRQVQLAILNGSVKLYLKLEEAAEDLVTQVLKLATDESDNPDLRNRGYIYWRMLSSNPEEAKAVILCEKPTISEDSGVLDNQLLDKLVDNIGMLASVYYKPPETFVKKIRDRINERFDLEYDGEQIQGEFVKDSTGQDRSQYEKEANVESYHEYMQGHGNLLGLDEENKEGVLAIDEILGTNQPK